MIEERGPLLGVRVFRFRQHQTQGQYAPGPEAWIDSAQIRETAEQQHGADQQDKGQRNIEDDQRVAQRAAGAETGSSAARLQRIIEIHVCGLQDWCETKQQAGENSCEQGERKHAQIELQQNVQREIGGDELLQDGETPVRKQHAQEAANTGQQQILRE